MAKQFFRILLTAALAMFSAAAFSQNGEPNPEENTAIESMEERQKDRSLEDELSGIILNRTMTIIGQQFYDEFNTFWRLSYPNNQLTFAIYERPTARFGSEVWVEYRGRQVIRLFLSPSRAQIAERAKAVAQAANEKLSQLRLTELLSADEDLARDEI